MLIWRLRKSGLSLNPDIHHSKVPSSELKTLEWDIINSEITSLNSCGEQAIFKLDNNYSSGYLDISF